MNAYYIMYYVFSALLGLVVGSFLNVCVYRLPRKIPMVAGRSKCPKCGSTIAFYDNIPLLSFAILRGKCRSCRKPISWRYPLIELLCGLSFLSAALIFGLSFTVPLYFVFFSCLICIAFIDGDTKLIPDRFIVIIALLGVAAFFLVPETGWLSRVIGAFSISVPMLVIALLTHGFGGGDIKLMAASGLLLGWELNLFGFFLAIVFAAAYSIAKLAGKSATRKERIPFGPFLSAGLALSALAGPAVVAWYSSLIYFP